MLRSYLYRVSSLSRNVQVFLLASCFSGFTFMGVNGVVPNLYLLRLGYGPEFIGLVNASVSLSFGLACLPAAAIGGRWGHRPAMLAGLALVLVGLVLRSQAEIVPEPLRAGWLLVTSVIVYPGFSLFRVNGMPWLAAATTVEQRRNAFSLQMGLEPLAAFLGALVGGALPGLFASLSGLTLDSAAPYRHTLLLGALVYVPAILTMMRTRERATPAQPVLGSPTGRGAAPYGLIAIIGVVVVLRMFGRGSATTFFNVYMDTVIGARPAAIGTWTAFGQLVASLGALSTPLIMSHLGVRWTFAGATLAIALCLVPLALVPLGLVAGLAYIGVTSLFAVTTTSLRVFSQEVVPEEWRGVMAGVYMTGGGTGMALTSLAGGYLIARAGFAPFFLGGACVSAIGTAGFLAYFRTPRGEYARLLDGAELEAA